MFSLHRRNTRRSYPPRKSFAHACR